MKIQFFKEAKKIWEGIAQDARVDVLNFELEIHKKLLSIFQVGDYYYFIFNVGNAEFEYVSPEIEKILGYNESITAIDFLNNIHPEDQPYFLNFENTLHNFFRGLPLEKYTKYKVRYDFRIKNTNGDYIRLLHQLVILQHDDEGNITRSLGIHTDIGYLKPEGVPMLSFIGMEGEPSFTNVQPNAIFTPAKELFSKREKQVLRLLAEGKSSADISGILNISKFTTDTHRRNMMKKTSTHSGVDLVMKSVKEGWI
ncbi:PAS domain-containing protein [Flavobacterium sp. Sd200]|uniref:LuxR C-terminal-related transcriptional regulator n=1 Tax=Flavobacterium sp. Sd200 TaxID=2692211 RepID=UPI00137227FA|nr:LuxR C-terminal-related transcriptional regulator [Flavobacterium sp. Sd200]MXN91918.1 PAS domain-containing protein [Flavobacterium sp. Sd200]